MNLFVIVKSENISDKIFPSIQYFEKNWSRGLKKKSVRTGVIRRGGSMAKQTRQPIGNLFGLMIGKKDGWNRFDTEKRRNWSSYVGTGDGCAAFRRIENEEKVLDDSKGSREGNVAEKVAVTNPRRVIEVVSWPGFTLKHLTLLRLDSSPVFYQSARSSSSIPWSSLLPFHSYSERFVFIFFSRWSTPTRCLDGWFLVHKNLITSNDVIKHSKRTNKISKNLDTESIDRIMIINR